ncbi:MAG: hypothetical protein IJ309_05305 [Clostridia bacterium]|nr:hypothetical protein [Clostridia bacterium]
MKDKQKKVNGKKANQKPSTFWKHFHNIMPCVLASVSVIFLVSLSGIMGQKLAMDHLANGLRGTFSLFGAVFLSLGLIYHAFLWKYDVKRKICFRRVVCSIITVLCVGTLQHLIEYNQYGITALGEGIGDWYILYAIAAPYTGMGVDGAFGSAIESASHGGGIFGGAIGNFLYVKTHPVFAFALVLVLLLFMFLQMFNITPYSMVSAIAEKNKSEKAESKAKKEKKKRRKKRVDIFDDGEDEDEESLIKSTQNKKPEYLDVNKFIDQKKDKDKEDAPVKSDDYEDAEDQLRQSRLVNSPQLRTYVEDEEPRLDVTASKVEDKEEDIPWEPEDTTYVSTSTPTFTFSKEEPKKEPVYHYEEPKVEPVYHYEEPKDEPAQPIYHYEEPKVEPVYHYEETKDDPQDDYEEAEEETVYVKEPVNQPPVSKPVYTFVEDDDEEDEEMPPDAEVYEDEDVYEEEEPVVKPSISNYTDSKKDNDALLNEAPAPKAKPVSEPKKPEKVFIPKPKRNYKFPPISFLQEPAEIGLSPEANEELQENARIIVETLNNFNIKTKISTVTRGPTVTRYELTPEPGVRVRSIANLTDDIALQLAAEGLRIECPIPGKSAVGIEVPNRVTSMVYLRELLDDPKFKSSSSPMYCALGKSISGENIYVDVEKTPHLLVAGATGMGKSVCINSLLVSLLYKATPDEVRLILVDPKRVELSNYNGVPHLLVPVVCEPKKSLGALQWAVTEMEKRFETIEQAGVRNLHEFNEKVDEGYPADKMYRILIVIDELADLKMAVPDIEGHITRLTQKARAAGIHIIIGTQRPSVDVITGLIKSNIPSRIAFRVPSQVDSRTILDEVGADKLVSRGDMLVKIVGALRPARVQGSFVKASEIQNVIDFWKETAPAEYDEEVMHQIDNNAAKLAKSEKGFNEDEGTQNPDADDGGFDPEFYNALELATEMGKISSSFLQRKLRLGFQRAARIIDQMEECGYIGEANGSKPRDVLLSKEDFRELMMRRTDDTD